MLRKSPSFHTAVAQGGFLVYSIWEKNTSRIPAGD